MGHVPQFWANKIQDDELVARFWRLVNWGFGGETAYCRVMGIGYEASNWDGMKYHRNNVT